MKPVTEVLLSAAFALTPEENWVRGWEAADERGHTVFAQDDDAVSFCMVSAIYESARVTHIDSAGLALRCLSNAVSSEHIGAWNDGHTHAEVLAALYKAAELSEADNG